jgi:hypothetical protein
MDTLNEVTAARYAATGTRSRSRDTFVSGNRPPGLAVRTVDFGTLYLTTESELLASAPSHEHHAGCGRCGISLPFTVESDAAHWVKDHAISAHGAPGDFDPALFRSPGRCPVCRVN